MDPIDAYLQALAEHLRGVREPTRSELVAEVEDHLRSAVDASVAGGADASDASRAAVAQFGDARLVAEALAAGNRRIVLPRLVSVPMLVGLSTSMAIVAAWGVRTVLRVLANASLLSPSCEERGAIPCPARPTETSPNLVLQARWELALVLVVASALFVWLWRGRPLAGFGRVPPALAAGGSAVFGTIVAMILYGVSDLAVSAPTWLAAAAVSFAALRGPRSERSSVTRSHRPI